MLEADVSMMRLLDHARALACRVCQSIKTREMVLLPAGGEMVVVADVVSARSWLRKYAQCGRYGRSCFRGGQFVCSVFSPG